jgi:hypothetical protein
MGEKIDYLVEECLASMWWPCFGLVEDEMWAFEDDDDDRVSDVPHGWGDYRMIPTMMVSWKFFASKANKTDL